MHFHKWTNWQDVKIGDELVRPLPMLHGFILLRQVIKQQRRCKKCNMVETRTT